MLAHCNLKQNMCSCWKQSSLFSFYALPSGGKSKDAVVHSFLGLVRIASIIILSWRFEPQLRHKENFKQREGYPCGKMGHHHLPLFIRYIIWFVSNWVLLKLPLTEFEQWTFVLVATGLPTCHQQPIRYRFALANATGINDVGEIDHITSKLRNDES